MADFMSASSRANSIADLLRRDLSAEVVERAMLCALRTQAGTCWSILVAKRQSVLLRDVYVSDRAAQTP